MEGEQIPTEKLVKAYIRMRDARSELKAKFEEEDNKIVEQMNTVERLLLEVCKKAGADSVNIKGAGTIIRGVSTRYWTSDWEAMHNFIKENNAVDLLERRIAQTAMKEFLKENPDRLPKGLNVDSKYTITVRRS